MLHKTRIGVCMDDGVAYLLEEKNDENIITIIEADESDEYPATISKTGRRKSKKENSFVKKVFDIVKNFDKVSLFGAAPVSNELLNRIKAHNLPNIEISNTPLNVERVTEKQKIDFINRYFEEAQINTA